MNNWDEFKCRCSGIKRIMSTKQGTGPITEVQLKRISELEARTKPMTEPMKLEYAELVAKRDAPPKVVLSDTCIEYLMEVYAWNTRGMIALNKESLDLMQLRKGKQGEQESGVLLSVVDGQMYMQHKERISNDYLSGEIDFYLGESVYKATNITDTKNAFDYPTFLKKINNGLENGQKEQLQGYGDITGASDLYIANCLVSFTQEMVDDMKYKVLRKINCATTESPEFLEKWPEFQRSMFFDEIPHHQRVFKIKVEPFTEFERQKVYDRVKYCREWLFAFDEMYQSLNK